MKLEVNKEYSLKQSGSFCCISSTSEPLRLRLEKDFRNGTILKGKFVGTITVKEYGVRNIFFLNEDSVSYIMFSCDKDDYIANTKETEISDLKQEIKILLNKIEKLEESEEF